MNAVKITNLNQKKTLAKDAEYCSSVWKKGTGLMFAKKPRALIFPFDNPRRMSLHMFFVYFPIDILILNKMKRVVEIKKDFRPWQMYWSEKEASYVVELPEKTIQKTGTKVGDRLSFE